MGCLAEKSRNLTTLHNVRAASDPQHARQAIAEALPSVVADALQPAEYDALYLRLKTLPEPAERARLGREDWLGSLAVFALVFLSTFPVVVPFIFMRSAGPALRVSNAVAIVMLFATGYAYGHIVGRRPWLVGLSMVLLGSLLAGLAMALGG